MLRKPIPLWVLAGGGILTMIAGCVNAVGFLSLQRMPLSHMSGTVCAVGMDLAAGNGGLLWNSVRVLIAFFLGAMLSGFIVRQSSLRVGRRYGFALMTEAALLFAAMLGFRHETMWGVYLAAMACGLQNAMASSYSGAVVRTTHMTGMITDIGIACGHLLRGQPMEWRRFGLYATLLSGFLTGSFVGAVAYQRYGYDTLLFPAFFAGVTGLGHWAVKHAERLRARQAKAPAGMVDADPSFRPTKRVPYLP
jgi:uncharacterized membrane protein YoaK (UPF0700 family)